MNTKQTPKGQEMCSFANVCCSNSAERQIMCWPTCSLGSERFNPHQHSTKCSAEMMKWCLHWCILLVLALTYSHTKTQCLMLLHWCVVSGSLYKHMRYCRRFSPCTELCNTLLATYNTEHALALTYWTSECVCTYIRFWL